MKEDGPAPAAFSFLIPSAKERMRVREVQGVLGRKHDFVISMIDEGQLAAFVQIRNGERRGFRVETESVAQLLADQASYDPADFLPRLCRLLASLDTVSRKSAVEMASYVTELHETGTLLETEAHDPMIPYREDRRLLSTAEVERCLDRAKDFIYRLIDEGTLEAHSPLNREKRSWVITRRSVCLTLAEQAAGSLPLFFTRLLPVMRSLDAAQVSALASRLTGNI